MRTTQRARTSRNRRRRHTRVRRGGNVHSHVDTLLKRLDSVTNDMKTEYVRSNDYHLFGLIKDVEQAKLTYYQSLPEPKRDIPPSMMTGLTVSADINRRYKEAEARKHMTNMPPPPMMNMPPPIEAWMSQMDQQHGVHRRPPLAPSNTKKLSHKMFSTR